MHVSIIIPVIRPDKAKRCIEAIRQNAGVQEIHGTLHRNDWPNDPTANTYEIITEEDRKRIGVTKMVKRLVEKSKGDAVCFIGDDCIPQKDFLKNALRAMAEIPDGWGLVSFNDNPNTTRSAAHWVAHKKLLPFLDGEFFHTGYRHCFCDDELMIRVQNMNRYIYAYDAKIFHEHPAVHKFVAQDESFKKVHSPEIYNADHALFQSRMRNDWKTPQAQPAAEPAKITKPVKVAIGLPSGDLLHADFATAFVNLCIYSMTRGVHIAIINQKSSVVEISRNQIVQEAEKIGADYILWLDSDMTFPAQTLQRLLSHQKDIVCVDAVRRREPITQVLTGMDNKPLQHKKDPGPKDPLVEVKGGTCAVQLIKMDVYAKLSQPHFLVTYNEKNGQFLGEDYYFSNKARTAGFKILCDAYLSAYIGHIGCKTFFLSDAVENPVKA